MIWLLFLPLLRTPTVAPSLSPANAPSPVRSPSADGDIRSGVDVPGGSEQPPFPPPGCSTHIPVRYNADRDCVRRAASPPSAPLETPFAQPAPTSGTLFPTRRESARPRYSTTGCAKNPSPHRWSESQMLRAHLDERAKLRSGSRAPLPVRTRASHPLPQMRQGQTLADRIRARSTPRAMPVPCLHSRLAARQRRNAPASEASSAFSAIPP